MNEHTVTVIIKGVEHHFNGDALTSPKQQAMLFLIAIVNEERVF